MHISWPAQRARYVDKVRSSGLRGSLDRLVQLVSECMELYPLLVGKPITVRHLVLGGGEELGIAHGVHRCRLVGLLYRFVIGD